MPTKENLQDAQIVVPSEDLPILQVLTVYNVRRVLPAQPVQRKALTKPTDMSCGKVRRGYGIITGQLLRSM